MGIKETQSLAMSVSEPEKNNDGGLRVRIKGKKIVLNQGVGTFRRYNAQMARDGVEVADAGG